MPTTRTETKHFAREVRHNGKCKRCNAHHSVLATIKGHTTRSNETGKVLGSHAETFMPDGSRMQHGSVVCCGAAVSMLPVKGTVRADIKCGAKCLSSKGHVCECSCGGKNHGAG